MSPNHSSPNIPRIDRNLPPNPEREPTAPPSGKYQSNATRFPEDFPPGPWPTGRILKAPIYCAVDNRDGHQCFKTPLSIDGKVALTAILRELNYGQMEIGYPSSNETEFNAVRELISKNHLGRAIPQVLTLASIRHIDRTLESLQGAVAAIVHVYHTTARNFQERKNVTINDIIRKTTGAIAHLKERSRALDGEIFLQVSAESFQDTRLVEAVAFYQACIKEWDPTPERPMIINIPNTVERDDPHQFANKVHHISDQIRKWGWRDAVIISVHTHDDCAGAVQAARLCLMTGAADRVEGTEFGHGERSGNMSLNTFKWRLYIDGIDPQVYRATVAQAERYEKAIGVVRNQVGRDVWRIKNPEQMISDRTHFIGRETRTVSTGVHADTTYHELEQREADPSAGMNYTHLICDPRDVGADGPEFQGTSQQGVTGMAAACGQKCGFRIPEWMRTEYYHPAKAKAVTVGEALTKEEHYEVFVSTFVQPVGAFEVVKSTITKGGEGNGYGVSMSIRVHHNVPVEIVGKGGSIAEAVTKAMRGVGVIIDHLDSVPQWSGSNAVVCAKVTVGGSTFSGAGISTNGDSALIDAIISAINRRARHEESRIPM